MLSLDGTRDGRAESRYEPDGPDWSGDRAGADETLRATRIPLTCSTRWQGRSQMFGCRTRLRNRIYGGQLSDRPWQVAASLFMGAALLYGVALGGHVDRTLALVFDGTAAAVVKAGFSVRRLTIEGQKRATDRDIVRALQVGPDVSMLSFDTGAAQERLEQLPWVRRAEVMRLLPSTLRIVIDEREPFAVWQIKGERRLIDMHGAVIASLDATKAVDLPLVVGDGAERHAASLFDALASHQSLKQQLGAAVRVADRRWNLKLTNGIEIRLPQEHAEAALDKLAELDESHGVLSSAVVSIDLRLHDRVTLRLTGEAAADLNLTLTREPLDGTSVGRET